MSNGACAHPLNLKSGATVEYRGADAKNATFLSLQGTSGGESDLFPLGEAVAPGAASLTPRRNVIGAVCRGEACLVALVCAR